MENAVLATTDMKAPGLAYDLPRKLLFLPALLALAGCISSSSPPPPAQHTTVVVPPSSSSTTVVCPPDTVCQ